MVVCTLRPLLSMSDSPRYLSHHPACTLRVHVLNRAQPILLCPTNTPTNHKTRLVFFASGLAHITLPNTTITPTTEAWIQGGKYGLILAADTPNVSRYGHITMYPSDADTVAMQVPFADGKVPDHEVLHEGPCGWAEMVGI